MSELITYKSTTATISALLVTVSSMALANCLIATPSAAETQSDRPTVWIELGGQLERRDADDPHIQTVFDAALRTYDFFTPADVQQAPRYSVGGEAKLTLLPSGSDWMFSAAVRYGRSNGNKHRYEQYRMPSFPTPNGTAVLHPSIYDISDAQVRYKESHSIVDFQAGKDVGIGLFGGESAVGVGVRFAQFNSQSSITAYAQPHATIRFPAPKYIQHLYYSRYTAHEASSRSFHGIGPSIFWKGTAQAARLSNDSGLSLNWDFNASVLFGRQRVDGFQSTHEKIETFLPFPQFFHYRDFSHEISRAHSVAVPNVGGAAAISFDLSSAKLTLGYRADFFFGAMDSGMDAAKRTTVGFYGPFATVSIGLP